MEYIKAIEKDIDAVYKPVQDTKKYLSKARLAVPLPEWRGLGQP